LIGISHLTGGILRPPCITWIGRTGDNGTHRLHNTDQIDFAMFFARLGHRWSNAPLGTTRVTHEKFVKCTSPLNQIGRYFRRHPLVDLTGVLKVSNDQSVSHSSVLFGTLLNSTPVS
jgi:hypothetical protein